ncbi:MAG: hypothetical protein FWD38_09645 [Oscillospiraceae bacterium]|nr:hypothetical protein [Oscillospiraceae bacterium]
MTKVTFRNIVNIEQLFKMIDSCKGPVCLVSSSSESHDLRENEAVKELITVACSKGGINKMNVMVNDNRDMHRVIKYLISCR